MSKKSNIILLALFAIGAVLALGKVFVWGESVTNYGSYTTWGLWVGLYIFLVGLAAGAAWTGIYAAYRNHGEPNQLTNLSLIVAGVSLAFGLAFIGIDLGKPLKGSSIFLSPSFSSKLTWASWIYTLFFGCLAGYFLTQAKRVFMILAGVAAAGFVLAEGLFFGGMVARTLWHTWLTPLSFFTSAVAAGCGMVYAVGLISSRNIIVAQGAFLRRTLIFAVITHVVVEGIHLASGLAGGAEKVILTKTMWTAVPFWGMFLIVGVIAPLTMLFKKSDKVNLVPPFLVLFGLAAYKYSFVRYGFSQETIPGISNAFQHARLSLTYTPSSVEWIVAIGFLSGLLLVANFVVTKFFAMKDKKQTPPVEVIT
ncbi:NrfD/PsrC family molybdoenzyme membrane anchor subunit [Pelosinus sp. IPA-1]|uniref:NrfD/PsrC family molybdoenzyme membrane anchor subunit n=1 Tax=Pelosinus sp. IPA-1 TaxID=3029569 RepID=UPI00243618A5|nr:NrfD/PsrC family molybdoenzyme membrane anchor subunit [Pelosinus sp. IPA-1]GMB02250.1 polysulfide reductase [Pelosinus sp. IPA-1]